MTSHIMKPAAISDAFMNAVNSQDISRLTENFADDVVYWEASLQAPLKGRKAVENHFRENWTSFSNTNMKLTRRIESGDWLADEIQWSATNTGPINAGGQTIPATGKRAQGPCVAVVGTENGKVKSLNIYYDNMLFLTQLGLAPQGGQQ